MMILQALLTAYSKKKLSKHQFTNEKYEQSSFASRFFSVTFLSKQREKKGKEIPTINVYSKCNDMWHSTSFWHSEDLFA